MPSIVQTENNTLEKTIIPPPFPYTKREIITLPEQSIARIINGCFSTYSSIEIMKVFNPREYLAKMFGAINLKTDRAYLTEIEFRLLSKKMSIDDAFYEFVKYLDKIAYKENGWFAQTKGFNKDIYPTDKNDQRERTTQIPEIKKAEFIESIFFKPADYIRNHNYLPGRNPDYRLIKGTKTGYAEFLIMQLMTKWNNQDAIK
jgi:hypothetical protein